ncbi:MAG: PaaI family thioesterase [Spongiibacter marinus]|uniref:PaaI family thioesterase n=1 Tax=Spongiibacter marinus TaxID=354246 RepID=UPI003C4381D3
MEHPFAEHIGLQVLEQRDGYSECELTLDPARHMNPHQVVHGAVLYALADTGMGAAVYPGLAADEYCATVEIKINYFRPAISGTVRCVTEMVNRGRSLANLESRLYCGDKLLAQANGNFAIIPRR